MPRYTDIVNSLKQSIRRGDFIIHGFPSERRVAELTGASRMTARRAIQTLVSEGVLLRQSTSRVIVNPHYNARQQKPVAFLATASNSPFVANLRVRAQRMAPDFGYNVRCIDYIDWSDPAFTDTLASFERIFLVGSGYAHREEAVRTIKACPGRVVCVEGDLSAAGIPSILLYPQSCVFRLLDHLRECGHRIIDCVNTLPLSQEVENRINDWRKWLSSNGLFGELFDTPDGSSPDGLEVAYRAMARYLRRRHSATAVFSTGEGGAVAMLRAMLDAGVRPGQDLSLCAIGGNGLYLYTNPPLTAIETVQPEPYYRQCFDWFDREDGRWQGPLLVQPEVFTVFAGGTVARLA